MITLSLQTLASAGENSLAELLRQLNANFAELSEAAAPKATMTETAVTLELTAAHFGRVVILEDTVTVINIELEAIEAVPLGSSILFVRDGAGVSVQFTLTDVTLTSYPTSELGIEAADGAIAYLTLVAADALILYGATVNPA